MTDTATETVPAAATTETAAPHVSETNAVHTAETASPEAAAVEMSAPEMAAPAASESTEDLDAIDKALDANDAIKNHVIASMAVGLVPIPGVDLAGTLAIQVRMVHQICGIYGVTLRENAAKTAVLSLLGSLMPVALAGGLVSGLKAIPGLGSLTGAAGVSLLGGATTYAVGSVFQQHLESHDSLIDFDPTKVSSVMRREFDAGLTVARGLRGKVSDAIITKEKEKAKETAAAEQAGAEPMAADAAPAGDEAKQGASAMRRELDTGLSAVRSLGDRMTRAFKKPSAEAPATAANGEAAPAAATHVEAAPAAAPHADAAHAAPETIATTATANA